jgi:hypothetical protein
MNKYLFVFLLLLSSALLLFPVLFIPTLEAKNRELPYYFDEDPEKRATNIVIYDLGVIPQKSLAGCSLECREELDDVFSELEYERLEDIGVKK